MQAKASQAKGDLHPRVVGALPIDPHAIAYGLRIVAMQGAHVDYILE